MQHFFVTPDQVKEDKIYITGSDVNHMKNVLRMKQGEQVQISDGNNRQYVCRISAMTAEKVELDILEETPADTELASRLYLFQGLPKADKMELIVQKAVELGVYEIIPTMMKRSIVKLDAKKAGKKTERWNAISESAAKQAGRALVPKVTEVVSFQDALQKAKELDVLLVPYELAEGMEQSRKVISSIRPGQSVGIWIGPEGGFEREEVDRTIEAGAQVITLGKRILRTETAGLTTLSILMYQLEQ